MSNFFWEIYPTRIWATITDARITAKAAIFLRSNFSFKKTAEEQHVEEATKTFAAATLNGVRPIDRYKDEKKGIYYVVVKMDLEDVKDMLTQSQELNSQMRDFVRKNADRAFERLEKEEQKREAPR